MSRQAFILDNMLMIAEACQLKDDTVEARRTEDLYKEAVKTIEWMKRLQHGKQFDTVSAETEEYMHLLNLCK